jgi:cyclophilin family peptidyl-prolyl cis-trans isomerase
MRELKVAEQQKRARRNRTLRRVIGALVVVGVVVGVVVLLTGKTPKKHVAATTTTTAKQTAVAPVCPPATAAGAKKRVVAFTKAPPTCISATGVYDATVKTDVGTFVVRMPAASSLAAVNNFVFLSRYHFFDGTPFHRVIPGFVVQGGSPNGSGNGGPGYEFTGNTPPKTCTAKSDCYPVGGLAMANSSGPSTDGSQFFVVLPGGQTQLDSEPNYTLFGQVVSGMAVVERIGADGSSGGTPKVLHHIVKATITKVS